MEDGAISARGMSRALPAGKQPTADELLVQRVNALPQHLRHRIAATAVSTTNGRPPARLPLRARLLAEPCCVGMYTTNAVD